MEYVRWGSYLGGLDWGAIGLDELLGKVEWVKLLTLVLRREPVCSNVKIQLSWVLLRIVDPLIWNKRLIRLLVVERFETRIVICQEHSQNV